MNSIPEHLRKLARQYLDMSVNVPGDALFAQIKEECEKAGVTPREAFEYAIKHPSDGPPRKMTPPPMQAVVMPASTRGTLTLDVIAWGSEEQTTWIAVRVPGLSEHVKVTVDSESFERVLKPAIHGGG